MKIATWIILGVVVLIVVALVVVYINLNSIVHRTIETQATASLDLQTQLDDVSLALFGGQLGLEGLTIASPEGYEAPAMLALGGADVEVSYGQLRQDPVRIQSITLTDPKLVIEREGTQFNFQVLMDKQSEAPPEGEPLRLMIDQLNVTGAQVVLLPGIPGLAQEITVAVPDIALQNIGTGEGAENGAAIKEVTMQVITAMAARAAESEDLPPEVRAILAGNIREVASQLANEQLDKLTGDLLEDLPEDVAPEVGGTIDAIRRGEDPGRAVEEGLGGFLRRQTERQAPTTTPAQ